MAKLGYTFYPKDWSSDDGVFELNLAQRGFYRELIDMAMLSDNKTVLNLKTWSRKLNSTINELQEILDFLTSLNLIEITENTVFIPSCEKRLNLIRGGRKSKPNNKSKSNLRNVKKEPISKPLSKPISKQIEREIETKKKVNINNNIFLKESISDLQFMEVSAMQTKTNLETIEKYLDEFERFLIQQNIQKQNIREFKQHFTNWLNKQEIVKVIPKQKPVRYA